MDTGHTIDYTAIISSVIQDQMKLLGPELALLRARKIEGLEIDEQGVVRSTKESPQHTLEHVVAEYVTLSGEIVRSAVHDLCNRYSS